MSLSSTKEYKQNYYKKNREIFLTRTAKWFKDNPCRSRALNHACNLRDKIKTFELLGNSCVICGFSDIRALQIDHINGGGMQEMKSIKFQRRKYHRIVRESVLANENKYQTLCANCNWIKRHEKQEAFKYKVNPI